MRTIVPNYYKQFHCIAGACRHTCCVGWEIDVDEESLERFLQDPWIKEKLVLTDPPQIGLLAGERCPFLQEDGLCEMILKRGEESLCGICRDHPRFRTFWTDRVEMGLGLVCEEAARLILSQKEKVTLEVLEADGKETSIPADEAWLMQLRQDLLMNVQEEGPLGRLKEYLLFRHLPDALYDDRLEARILFVEEAFATMKEQWQATDGSLEALVEIVRCWSYDTEYDEEVLEEKLALLDQQVRSEEVIDESAEN